MNDLELTADCPCCPNTSRGLSLDWAVSTDGSTLLVERWTCKCGCYDSLLLEVDAVPYLTWDAIQDGLKRGEIEIEEFVEDD